jgi:hypothetical protein
MEGAVRRFFMTVSGERMRGKGALDGTKPPLYASRKYDVRL